MKKILSIIVITILFVTALLIFWVWLLPSTFYKFVGINSVIDNALGKVGIVDYQVKKIYQATSSEPVLSSNGQIIIDGSIWNVNIANNDTTRTNGLSNRRILFNKTGMLFAFDSMANQSFWMKDMLIPLDMIFFDDNWRIVLIESNLQPESFPEIFGNSVKSQYVLEINALEAPSSGLKVGDQAIFVNK